MASNSSQDPPYPTGQEDERQNALEPTQKANPKTLEQAKIAKGSAGLTKAQELTSGILQFLSTASNGTLGACAVGLASITYFLLGRVGLVLIGIVGGVVLHATWEENVPNQTSDGTEVSEARRRKEASLNVVERVLDWREKQQGKSSQGRDNVQDVDYKIPTQKEVNFSGFQPATAAALGGLTDAVIRDYVKWWYDPILPREASFPFACRQTLTGFLLSVSSHLFRKRPADTFLDFLTNSSSIVIVFFNELSGALMHPGSSGLDPADALSQYLEANPDSSLANVVDVKQQEKKLKAVAEDILQTFLDSNSYNCEPVRAFLREILAGLVLEMTVQSCSKPEWINGWIVYLLEEADTELMDAIDAGVGGATANGSMKFPIRPTSNGRSIESPNSPNGDTTESQSRSEHKRTLSRAEDAMDEAMQEAKRLSELMASEDAREREVSGDSLSSSTTAAGKGTPTSSQSDLVAGENSSPARLSGESEFASMSLESIPSNSTPSFTSFDQIIPPHQPTALQTNPTISRSSDIPPLTLYNAIISIFDDSATGDKGTIRSKPVVDYLLQIEPATSQYPGWMIARKYADFETLHEVLRRISVVSGVSAFTERHATIPGWKNRTKTALRVDLERYLRDALSFERLAESEGMKRFLEKDQGMGKSSPSVNKGGFAFPSPAAFETMGKGMLDVLVSAPKGVAGGGKALVGGVTGVLGNVGSLGQKKQASVSPGKPTQHSIRQPSNIDSSNLATASPGRSRESLDSLRSPLNASTDSIRVPPLPSRPDHVPHEQYDTPSKRAAPNMEAVQRSSLDEQKTTGGDHTMVPTTPNAELELHLPPPPSEISDDYSAFQDSPRPSNLADHRATLNSSTSTGPTTFPSSERKSLSSSVRSSDKPSAAPLTLKREAPPPLSEKETQVAVELFFAVINELYTLSSAWNIRRTLLNAAKGFLLRPGNPSLEAIRVLLQKTIIEDNTSDAGLASHLTKLRENSLPTEEELKAWPPPPTEEEKATLRLKARKLLVERGMPQALTSVMGAAASGEALGRVFDCLQVEQVARGLMFALILQGIRAVTQ